MPFNYVGLIASSLMGFFIFEDYPDVFSWIGGGIILLSVYWITFYEKKYIKGVDNILVTADIDKIYFKHERKMYIDRKTLEMKNPRHDVIGQCKPVDTGNIIEEELEEILKNNTLFNQI